VDPTLAAVERGMALTRDQIRDGHVRRMIAELGLAMRLLSDDELAASRAATLAGIDLTWGAWLFGYGSLIWNPAFHFTDRLIGTVYGYPRRFCLWTHLGRGCPERPGLVLGLERAARAVASSSPSRRTRSRRSWRSCGGARC
jgi:glutathione-specific gamma-glutamylcyclotransferase